MRTGFKKTVSLVAFGLVMAVVGGFAISSVSAQTAQDCNSASPSFWGWIACYIGSPSQGIANAPTLFQGQKAIYDKIGTNSGGGGTGAVRLAGHGVYLEKSGSTSLYFGEILPYEYPDNGGALNMWHRQFDNPLTATFFGANSVKVVFIPSEQKATEYSITRGGVVVPPKVCFLETNLQEGNSPSVRYDQNGMIRVKNVVLMCSYYPTICQNTGESTTHNCLRESERQRTLYSYSPVAPTSDMYQIRVK